MGVGSLQPINTIILGTFLRSFSDLLNQGPGADILTPVIPVILIFVYLGIANLVGGYICQCCWVLSGEFQTRRIRKKYVHAILRQEMSWFDKADEGSLTTRLAADTNLIQDGISEKFGQLVQSVSQFVCGFIIAFVKGWRLALVLLAALPLMAVVGMLVTSGMRKFTGKIQDSYADGGAIVEQAIAGIRTVYTFSLQNRFSVLYKEQVHKAYLVGRRRAVTLGLGFGVFMFLLFSSYGLAFWYGYTLVLEQIDGMDGAGILTVFMSMMVGAMSLLQIPQQLSAVTMAMGAAYKIYATIERIPEIDCDREDGLKPDHVNGHIVFKNVHFKYPTRPDTTVLHKLDLDIKPGMTVAFCGPSGSGKSTCVQLLQRFYDPLSGNISLDGHDIKDLNVSWLRQQIGVVSQEPVLFNMTIKQNLLMGSVGIDVTEEEIISACMKSNCHSFITQLPNGYDTIVGEHGGMLSGGQKQRIAIARALIKNPTILLLDEATSALDTASERLVQRALDVAAADRTTVVIAHRLSTIKNADLIVVMKDGKIIEMGKHNELLEMDGVYKQLVLKQKIKLQEDAQSKGVTDLSEIDPFDDDSMDDDQLEKALQQETVELATNVADAERAAKERVRADAGDLDAYQLKLQKEKELKKAALNQKAPMKRVLMMMKPEWGLLLLGIFGGMLSGIVFPAYALVFSRVVIMLQENNLVWEPPFQGPNLYAFVFVVIGIGAFFGTTMRVVCFEIAGEKYTERLRAIAFDAMLKQEIGYYDDDLHSLGAMTSRLAVDAANVNFLITRAWNDISLLVCCTITGLVIAFVNGWILTFIVLVCVPFLVLATGYEMRVHRGFENQTKTAYLQSGQVAAEAIKEIRTVASLTKQSHFEDRYEMAISKPHQLAQKKAYIASIAYGATQAMNMFTNAVAFYSGIRLIEAGLTDFQSMFTVLMAVMTTANQMGRASTFTSTLQRGKQSAVNTFEILDRKPLIDPEMEGIEPESVDGSIDMEEIRFSYPARPDIEIFKGNFEFHGKANTMIALVGPSGCGKSTTIGILQRWYDPSAGTAKLDGKNITDYSLHNLRSHMALVSQEPVLFDMSLRANVAFGIEDENVSDEKILEAAEMANIRSLIDSLPEGLDTRVGDKGSQLSGGQKQRIAIARALIRDPAILLLDEATSALDSESEKLVQQALDKALSLGKRTTITIAHRLSTIQNADLIVVVKDGQVVESGGHFELLGLNGVYADLVRQQNLNAN
ncbi:P-loop containing nucleoside triphosphate hydrolase protein [Umbelopsis sp. PMI_123]|nr:P-loop containing nucleoside triphosphate hydrolase protein [Umbelopsis sp. PMI_123]